MEIKVYNFEKNSDIAYIKMHECQKIIDENLTINGGTLRHGDLFFQEHDWYYLIVAYIDNEPIGLSLLRKSHEDKHNIGMNEYYYLSLIAVLPAVQKQGVGTELLNTTFNLPLNAPIVASCLKNNIISKHLLSKNMFNYDDTLSYHRFIYNKIKQNQNQKK